MPKQNKFAEEYKAIANKLSGMDPVVDAAAVRQLKNGKAGIVRSWQGSCANVQEFKAQLERAQFDLLPKGQQQDIGERVEKSIAALEETSKLKQKAGKR